MKLRELITNERVNLDDEVEVIDTRTGNVYDASLYSVSTIRGVVLSIDTTPTEDHKAKGKG